MQFDPGKKEKSWKTTARDCLSINHSSVLVAKREPASAAAMRE
jgi:hypothetical protein